MIPTKTPHTAHRLDHKAATPGHEVSQFDPNNVASQHPDALQVATDAIGALKEMSLAMAEDIRANRMPSPESSLYFQKRIEIIADKLALLPEQEQNVALRLYDEAANHLSGKDLGEVAPSGARGDASHSRKLPTGPRTTP